MKNLDEVVFFRYRMKYKPNDWKYVDRSDIPKDEIPEDVKRFHEDYFNFWRDSDDPQELEFEIIDRPPLEWILLNLKDRYEETKNLSDDINYYISMMEKFYAKEDNSNRR